MSKLRLSRCYQTRVDRFYLMWIRACELPAKTYIVLRECFDATANIILEIKEGYLQPRIFSRNEEMYMQPRKFSLQNKQYMVYLMLLITLDCSRQ